MEKVTFKYSQGNQIFYTTVLRFKEIIENSVVSIYSRDNRLGYQRALVERHLKKIVASLKKDDTPISPTSILLGIDEKNLTEKNIDVSTIVNFKSNNNHLFRIIDGQHRIMAMKKYIDELTEQKNATKEDEKVKEISEKIFKLNSYEFSVIIMPINDSNRIEEVKVFQSINAKAKPLKTDLVKLALTRYEEISKVNELDYTNHLAKRIIFSLNDNEPYIENDGTVSKERVNVWENAIIIDLNNDDEIGVIGYSAFYKSIEQICKVYINNFEEKIKEINDYEKLDKYLNLLSNELTFHLFIPCWNIIMGKWENCFAYKKIALDKAIYYDEEFYIQKNMGLRSLHNILYSIIKNIDDENIKDFKAILNKFQNILANSNLTDDDWLKGGRFKGLSSEAGFKYIESVITQEVS